MELTHPLLNGPKRVHGKPAHVAAPKLTRLTAAMVEALKTEKGGYSRAALARLGVSWPPPKGWKKRLIGSLVIVEP